MPRALDMPVRTTAIVHACRHCEKRFQSPGKLAQHERVRTKDALPFHSAQAVRQQEPNNARESPHRREAVRVLDMPAAVQLQEPRCAARAGPHGREALRLLDVPPAVYPQERRSPARADPHRREAVRLLNAMCPMRFANKSDVAPHE